MMKNIPNLFTLLNLICGCIAIIFILQTGEMLVVVEEGTWVPQLPEKIWWGSMLIGIAALVDFFDGFIARLFNATSPLGAQLDSLADVVSFGVAPGLILYQLLRLSFIAQEDGLDVSIWALAPALLFPAAAAWRLARFNSEKTETSGFSGLPTPAAGLMIASLPLIVFYNYFNVATIIVNKWVLYALIIFISYLMISRIPFLAMKFNNRSASNLTAMIVLAVVAIIAAVFLQWLAIPVVFILYIITSLTIKKQVR